nr:Transcription factor GTE11 [Ipomoea batatas]
MTIADLGNMKIRISIKGDNPEKGLKIIKNDNKKPESKKRGSDDFNRSITQDGGRVFPAPIRRRSKGCLQNPGGNDYQEMNNSTPPLQKEKESCSSDHSSSPTGAQLSPTKALRAAQMKKRYAHLISKANQGDNNADPQQERERIAEKGRTDEEIIKASGETVLTQRQREREAARIALEKMKQTVEFDDALQIMSDFETIDSSAMLIMICLEYNGIEDPSTQGT